MQEFDYSNETSNDLYDVVDGLSYEEAVSAKEAIEKIKEEKEEKAGGFGDGEGEGGPFGIDNLARMGKDRGERREAKW